MDDHGYLWVALFRTNKIVRLAISPDSETGLQHSHHRPRDAEPLPAYTVR